MKNNKKKKILISILIMFILLFCLGTNCFADENSNAIESAIDGVVGILLLPAKFIVLILGGIIGVVLGFFSQSSGIGLTIEDILFNKVPLVDINFFDFNTSNAVASAIRTNVAIWYTSIRNIAAIALAIIAVYVGIRMAISTIAEDKAKYKTMLYDWLTSLALLFILHYIMIFTININTAFINVLSSGLSNESFGSITDTFLKESLTNVSFTTGMGCALVYMILQAVTFVFLLSYVKRMITLAFLIVISPLVTITYSIDKMGDGKSQALNVWFKEYVYNILIQPFHCISYRVLAESAIQLMVRDGWANGAGLANAIIAIMLILFIYTSENIVKHIFHFDSKSMGQTVANAAIAGVVLNKVMSGGKKVSGASKGYASGKSSGSSKSNPNKNTKDSGAKGLEEGTNANKNSVTSSSNRNNNNSNSNSSINTTTVQTASERNVENKSNVGLGQKLKGAGKAIGRGTIGGAKAGLNTLLRANTRIAGAMVMGGLGLGLGDAKTGLAGAMAGASMGSNFASANDSRIMKHELLQYKLILRRN